MEVVILVLLGLCFGSFVNALVWRIHMQSEESGTRKQDSGKKKPKNQNTDHREPVTQNRYSILKGRSICIHCNHELGFFDLIPVFSWLTLRGKCRYCHKPISWQYPLVELTTAFLFIFSYVFWPYELQGIGWATFGLWLVMVTGFVALIVYDVRWMLLPNRIVYFLYGVAAAYVATLLIQNFSTNLLLDMLMGVVVGGGIFYLLFQFSKGKWIGGGDVKLGFLLGALAGSPSKALLLLFIASLLGCLYVLPLLLLKKTTRSKRIPFGPFLIIAGIIVVLFGTQILDAYYTLTLGVNY